MAMKPFVYAEALRIKLGLMDHENVINALSGAIISAQIYFEEVLQTRLMKQVNSDIFKLDSKLIYVMPDDFMRVRLKNSNVRTDTPVVVSYAASYRDMMTNQGVVVIPEDSGDYFINRDKGVVSIFKTYDTKCVKVTYASGYEGGKDAPDWMKEAIASYVPVLLNQQQIFNRAEEQKGVFDTGKEHAFTLMSPYFRDVGFCFRAMS